MPLCIIPSFSQNASRLFLPKRLTNCAKTRKVYKAKGALLRFYLVNYDSSKLKAFFIYIVTFDDSVCTNKQFVNKQIGILPFLW